MFRRLSTDLALLLALENLIVLISLLGDFLVRTGRFEEAILGTISSLQPLPLKSGEFAVS